MRGVLVRSASRRRTASTSWLQNTSSLRPRVYAIWKGSRFLLRRHDGFRTDSPSIGLRFRAGG